MDAYMTDLLAAVAVVLNGVPQGLLALSLGFAAFPTALFETAFACCCPEPEARISRYASRSSRVKTMESDARARVFF